MDWREAWRLISRELSTEGLTALVEALASDSPQLLQGSTTYPKSSHENHDTEIEKSCPIGYCLWKWGNLKSVNAVRHAFAMLCESVLGKHSDCKDAPTGIFFGWWDYSPRGEVVPLLLEETRSILAERSSQTENQPC